MTAASTEARAPARARIASLAGPVVTGVGDDPFRISEAVYVGRTRVLGEVLRIDGRYITIQVYEDTTGLRPGDAIVGAGQALAVRLGPGLLGGIFDGLLRPLSGTGSVHISAGMPSHEPATWAFEPALAVGDTLAGSEVLGHVGGDGSPRQACLVPPRVAGRVAAIEAAGSCADDAVVCRVAPDDGGDALELTLGHEWPVREPRPTPERLPVHAPLLTGQRIIDALFPVARGGKAAMPGGFGTGKTILQQSIAKWCDADIIVYVGCGERGNEMTEVLHDFPNLEDPRTGRTLIERSVIIANTSNMPVAAREASIYTGVTVAEYFRDQGLHVALMADSTSRWAEALREIGGRLGDMPTEGGYPAYLGTRKAEFYERAARVTTRSGDEGSVTLIGAVSPPGGDFSEPVTLHTQRNVRCFWPLDRDRARARFYPAINPLMAYSEDAADLAPWWREHGYAEQESERQRFLALLEEQVGLERMARIVGKEALPQGQQLTLLCAGLVNESFLRQSAFSDIDCFASPERQAAMMRLLGHFIDRCRQALDDGVDVAAIEAMPILRRLRRMGEEIGDDAVERFEDLHTEVDAAVAALYGSDRASGQEASAETGDDARNEGSDDGSAGASDGQASERGERGEDAG